MAMEFQLLGDLVAVEDTIDFWRALLMLISADVKSAAGERNCDVDGLADQAWLDRASGRLLPLVAAWPLDGRIPGFATMPKSLLRHAIYIILLANNDFEKPQRADDHDLDLHLNFYLLGGEFADFLDWSERRNSLRMNLISAGVWSWREFERGKRPDGRRIPVAQLNLMSKGDFVRLWSDRPLAPNLPSDTVLPNE